jgi:cephalosporin-C deacetylase-like acetyl esterase
MGRPADPKSPEQVGRQALYQYLDDIADKDTAERRAEVAKITTKAQAEARQQEVRVKMLELMGGGFKRTPLNAKVVGTTQMDGYRIEKVLYESQPNFYVTALLYVPDAGVDRSGAGTNNVKFPAIVMAPGHASSGKAGDFAMAALFARNGFAVLSYDPIGQGERLQYLDPNKLTAMSAGDPYPGASLASRATGEHGEAGLQPTLIGDAVARYFGWDGIRAVDYLVSRPEVDAEKIGAFGCSGGGAMTALLGAADKRVKATATACYFTSFDTLLPSIGAQDAEQSVPGFIAGGLDFPDWIEVAAPRAYAMVGTVSDMFPWAGFLKTATEVRRFYSLFDKSAEGTKAVSGTSGQQSAASDQLKTPTGPTLNPDTANEIPEGSPFQVIAGIGGHGNLKPIQAQIVGFFLVHLAGRSADEYKAPPAAAAGASPFALPDVPKGALQVTETGQVATSFPGSETVHSLNLKRAKEKIPQFMKPQTLLQVQTDVREVTKAEAVPGQFKLSSQDTDCMACSLAYAQQSNFKFPSQAGIDLNAILSIPAPGTAQHPAVLLLSETLGTLDSDVSALPRLREMTKSGSVALAITPRPSPAGSEEIKSPILGPFYMSELRAELVGKTLLGMRVDDVIRAVDYLASRPDVDPANITVVASGHMGLVALNAAVLDKRIKHVTVDHVLVSYDSLLHAPMPLDAPQDILPGVLLKYDIPDLVRVLGDRVTATDWLPGTANLAAK